MLLTTTSTLQDRRIGEYKGVVSGEAILGANAFRDMFAGIRDIVGGRSAAYERELQRAKDLALREMTERARDTGANAVIGIDLDYETVGQNGSMLMVTASGTAVVVTLYGPRGLVISDHPHDAECSRRLPRGSVRTSARRCASGLPGAGWYRLASSSLNPP